jgi:hypothetical protein
MMIWSSDVSISPEEAAEGGTERRTPMLPDPFVVLGNPERSSSGLLMGVYYFNKMNDEN